VSCELTAAEYAPGVERVSFRPLVVDDLPLMHRWLATPHVRAWWHERLDLDGVRAKYMPGSEGIEPTHVFVIECARPIGWIQWYRWADYPEHAARLGADVRREAPVDRLRSSDRPRTRA